MSKNLGGWAALPNEEGDYDVIPLRDLREHHIGSGCWCHPRTEDNVIVHNSLDKRELYERGELRAS